MDGANNFDNQLAWNDLDEEFCEMPPDAPCAHLFDEMVKRQLESDQDLSEPCPNAQSLLDLWSEDVGEDALPHWQAAVERHLNEGIESRCPEWDELLDRPVSITYGAIYTSKRNKRKSTRDDRWVATKMPWRSHINGRPTEKRGVGWGLGRSIESETKDGPGVVLGACVQRRKALSVASVCAIGLDIDSGHLTFKEVCNAVKALGCGFIAYTTYSHLTTSSEVMRDAVVNHAGCDGEPTVSEVKHF